MIESAKIQFSAEELELLMNREWILTKNRIIEKIGAGFEQLASKVQEEISDFYPEISEYLSNGFKVSRGEKYQGLPYLMLDYPRVFGKTDVLAIRVLLWWGNYYSVTLHTKGRFALNLYRLLKREKADHNQLLISSSGDEWNHNLLDGSYVQANEGNLEKWLTETGGAGFIKLSQRLELTDWQIAEEKLYRQYHHFLQMITTSFQFGGKGL